jgi:integrase
VKRAKTTRDDGKQKTWVQVAECLIKNVATGRYYARFKRQGKQHWKSLGTTSRTVADGNLAKERAQWLAEDTVAPPKDGKWTVGTALDLLMSDVNAGKAFNKKAGVQRKGRLAEGSQLYREQTYEALVRSWKAVHGSDIRAIDVRRLTRDGVEKWAFVYRAEVSAGRFNATLGTLRRALRYAREAGQVNRDVTSGVERESVRATSLNAALPTWEELVRIVEAIRATGHRTAGDAADFVELLAYTGARASEAAALTWRDVDFTRRTVNFRVTKNGRPRELPFSQTLGKLLERIKSQRAGEPDTAHIARVTEIRASLDKACKAIGCPRITRHGLRAFFATICLQKGMDVKTLAEWLGHRDGGLLLLQRYAKAAGARAAARLSFEPEPVSNVVAGRFNEAAA